MTVDMIHKNMNKNQVSNLYLIYGIETYRIEESKKNIIESVLSQEELDFNFSSFNMEEVSIDQAIEDAETMPFLGERRVVIVNNPLFLTSQKDKNKIEHDLERFQQYIQNPAPETVMLVIAPYDKLDERKKVVKLLRKHGQVFHAEEMDSKMITTWIEDRFAQNDVKVSSDAKERLHQLTGSKLMMLANEIDKMSLYVGKSGLVDEETVLKLVARSLEQNIFVLIDKVVQRKLSDALRIYYDLLEQKEEPIKILSLLSGQFRLIYQVKMLFKKGYGQKQVAGQLKVHPFRVKLASGQGRHFSEEELLYIIKELAEADYKMKSGKMDKVLLLELFFMKLNKRS